MGIIARDLGLSFGNADSIRCGGFRRVNRETCMDSTQRRLDRLPVVRKACGLSRSEIYRRMKAGTFPQSVPIGDSAVAWVSSEVDAWVEQRIAARDAKKAA